MKNWQKKAFEFLDSLDGHTWPQKLDLDKLWEEKFECTIIFVKKNQKLPSQHSKDLEERRLGVWIAVQRGKKKGSRKRGRILTTEQISKIESIPGFNWEINLDKKWNDNCNSLTFFVNKNKRFPDYPSEDLEETKLYYWLNTQRKNKKGIGDRVLTKEQIYKIESITGFKWEIDFEEIWNDNFKKVNIFSKKNKKLPSQCSKHLEERKLGVWISIQRQNKKGLGNWTPLTKEKISKLESLSGWYWDYNEIWNDNFECTIDFVRKNNKIPSSSSKDAEERRLGRWISTQRQNKKGKSKGRPLAKDQISKLESIPGWYW